VPPHLAGPPDFTITARPSRPRMTECQFLKEYAMDKPVPAQRSWLPLADDDSVTDQWAADACAVANWTAGSSDGERPVRSWLRRMLSAS
jgi:hypothetical protein